ncbi:MAG: hypothetical protein QM770_24805 [Tepidisphaeraceae bacterium]
MSNATPFPPHDPAPAVPAVRSTTRRYTSAAVAMAPSDLQSWAKGIDRLRLAHPRSAFAPSDKFLVACTYGSFRLEGITLALPDAETAIARDNKHRGFRSRLGQRLRNHAAILLSIERLLKQSRSTLLKSRTVLGWYTAISSGLSHTMPAGPDMARLDSVVRRVNSPHLRLGPAIQEIVELHVELLHDAIVPSFAGLLSRLILHYHLGRCGLLPVIFDPDRDSGAAFATHASAQRRIMDLVDESYATLA